MKEKLIQTNWASGELSPSMLGRVDTVKYQNGAAELSNFVVHPNGSLWRRTGTILVAAAKFPGKRHILQEFEFNTLQSYVIEMGELYIRIFFNGGVVETVPGNGVPLELTTLYLEADLPALKFCQSADVLYIFHPNYQTAKLERLGANSWVLASIQNTDGPYLSTFNLDQSNTVSLTNVSATAVATSKTALFSGAGSKAIASLNTGTLAYQVSNGMHGLYNIYYLVMEVTGHGLSVGNSLIISGVVTSSGVTVYFTQNLNVSCQVLVVVDANHIQVNVPLGPSGYNLAAIYDLASAKISSAAITVNYVEYRDQNIWKLLKILSVMTSTTAVVQPLSPIKTYDSSVQVTYSAGFLTADHSGVFTSDDIGAYIRLSSGVWYRVTAFTSDSVVAASAIALTSYSYPTNSVSIVGNSRTATATSDTANTFNINDVGRHMRLNFGGRQPWGIIRQYVTDKQVTIELFQDIPLDPSNIDLYYANGVTSSWKIGAWSLTTGFPSVGCFHQQRLCAAGTSAEPQTFWMSQSADYENMAPTSTNPDTGISDTTVTDDCAITYTLASNKANRIAWMVSGPVLLIGTIGAEWEAKASSSTVSDITPTNISVTPQTDHGSLPNCKASRIGYAVVFAQKSAKKAIELTYEFQMDSYIGRDLTVTSDHILRKGGGVYQIALQKEPNTILWLMLNDGTLSAVTYDHDQQVTAWHSHALNNGGKVESLCCVSSTTGQEDLLYLSVNRTINGQTVRLLEQMAPDYYPASAGDRLRMPYLDCASFYHGAPTNALIGFTLQIGETLSVVADGFYRGDFVVDNSGHLTVAGPAFSDAVAGYRYRSLLRMAPLEGGSRTGGTAQGKLKRSARTMLRIFNSAGFSYGTVLERLDAHVITKGDGMTPETALVSQDRVVSMPSDYSYTSKIYVVQDSPYPLNLLCVAPDEEVTQ